jgi:hypothetical protein
MTASAPTTVTGLFLRARLATAARITLGTQLVLFRREGIRRALWLNVNPLAGFKYQHNKLVAAMAGDAQASEDIRDIYRNSIRLAIPNLPAEEVEEFSQEMMKQAGQFWGLEGLEA